MDAVAGGAFVGRAGPFVEGNEVHLGRDAVQQLDQPVRVFLCVIHPVEHHIFKGDPFGIRQVRIVFQGCKQGLDVPFLVYRHQNVAHLVGGGVEGDSQQTADFGRGAGDFRHHARGGQGDAATAKGDAFVVHHHFHRVADVVEVVKRLAHAHQDDVRHQPYLFLGGARHRPFVQIIARQHDLTDNLGRGQVAHQFLRAGVAEGTGQRAAHLRGDAQRAAVGFGDIDHLDLMPALDAHQIFARAVG